MVILNCFYELQYFSFFYPAPFTALATLTNYELQNQYTISSVKAINT